MNLENTGLSRRKLLRTAAIGVPAAGAVAMGATLVTAPPIQCGHDCHRWLLGNRDHAAASNTLQA